MARNTTTHSLADRAVLVRQSIAFRGWSRKDSVISDHIAQHYKANSKRVRGSKTLIDSKFLKELSDISSQAYTHHKENTLPWENKGHRLLPGDRFLEYRQKQDEFKAKYEAAAKEFIRRYADAIADAKAELGDAFNPDDYPDPVELAEAYTITHDFKNVPPSDFRIAIPEVERRRIEKDAQLAMQARINDAMGDLWRRLEEQFAEFADRVAEYDEAQSAKDAGKDAPRRNWHTAWLRNVRDVVELIPAMNFMQDAKLDTLAAEARATLCRFEDEEMKHSSEARKAAVATAQEVLDKMGGLFGAPAEQKESEAA